MFFWINLTHYHNKRRTHAWPFPWWITGESCSQNIHEHFMNTSRFLGCLAFGKPFHQWLLVVSGYKEATGIDLSVSAYVARKGQPRKAIEGVAGTPGPKRQDWGKRGKVDTRAGFLQFKKCVWNHRRPRVVWVQYPWMFFLNCMFTLKHFETSSKDPCPMFFFFSDVFRRKPLKQSRLVRCWSMWRTMRRTAIKIVLWESRCESLNNKHRIALLCTMV